MAGDGVDVLQTGFLLQSFVLARLKVVRVLVLPFDVRLFQLASTGIEIVTVVIRPPTLMFFGNCFWLSACRLKRSFCRRLLYSLKLISSV